MKQGALFFSDGRVAGSDSVEVSSQRLNFRQNVGSALTIEHCGVGCDPQTEGHMRRCEFTTLIGGATASRSRAPRGTRVAAGGLPLIALINSGTPRRDSALRGRFVDGKNVTDRWARARLAPRQGHRSPYRRGLRSRLERLGRHPLRARQDHRSGSRTISASTARLHSTKSFRPSKPGAWSSASNGTTLQNTAAGSIWPSLNSAS